MFFNKKEYKVEDLKEIDPKRYFTGRQIHELQQLYELLKDESESSNVAYSQLMSPNGVFANNELNLNDIKIYGFDFDYTLARYRPTLHNLIYDHAKTYLVEKFKYPEDILKLEYLPGLGARGLHLDIARGWLMKIDSYHNIQLGTVYHGMNPVPDKDVIAAHKGTRLSIDAIGYFGMSSNMYQFVDIFSIPEITLLRDVMQDAVTQFHKGALHNLVGNEVEKYFEPHTRLHQLLERLRAANKQIFMITNSSYWFVERGMNYLVGDDWRKLFNVIICQARKPTFFAAQKKPFREYKPENNAKSWDRVTTFKSSNVYVEGNLGTFIDLTTWSGNDVLYIGDHIYGDLADLFLKHGWRTGAILQELKEEIETVNSENFQNVIKWLNILQWLIDQLQVIPGAEADILMKRWVEERQELRSKTKDLFNPHFGSIFRTYHNPTYFHRRLARFADIYTSNVCNLYDYPLDYIFFPRRMALAHENILPTPDLNLLLLNSAKEALRTSQLNENILSGLFPQLSTNEHEKIADQKEKLFRELALTKLHPTNGLSEILKYIEKNRTQLKIGLATNAPREVADFELNILKLDQHTFFDAIIVAEEFGSGKPDPAIYLEVCKRLQLKPESCLVFEDSPSGVTSASQAQTKCIGLLTSSEKEKLVKCGAYLTVKDFTEVNLDQVLKEIPTA
ncbi:unnamed protein product [Didymodactylos carnosus]|uniref:Uncharacterized protein n=1 Tax=Didymodactylos carnosus TaxID=1234261 RepID=A0A814EBA9_9BILA|nr:unnamed protein product [Didymodactylos carnosus]CAF0964050.1 unnamed protein product [Didymodactylos carnosus]CAF3529879.1 unnamed protein product [Didymodactylos carnosus]CAF3737859.1 unnamed protein product [Didymodactylos carnosus]